MSPAFSCPPFPPCLQASTPLDLCGRHVYVSSVCNIVLLCQSVSDGEMGLE